MISYNEAKKLFGADVMFFAIASIFFGVVLFAVEYSFIFVLQGFFFAIGLIQDESLLQLPTWYPKSLNLNLLILLLFGVTRGVILLLKFYISNIVSELTSINLRKQVLKYSLLEAGTVSTAEAVSLFTQEVHRVGYAVNCLVGAIVSGIVLFFFFISGIKIAPIEMLIGVICLLFAFVPFKSFNGKVRQIGIDLTSEWSSINTYLINGIKNNYYLRVSGTINDEVKNGYDKLDNYKMHLIRHHKYSSFFNSFPNVVGIIIVVIICYIGANFYNRNGPLLISFVYIFIRFVQNASDFSVNINQLRLNYKNVKDLSEWISEKKNLRNSHTISNIAKENLECNSILIEAENLSFRYPGSERWLFKNLNFSIKHNDVLLIEGESGKGKSTLLSLVLGVLPPSEGVIKVNQKPIDSVKHEIESKIAYVGPEPYLIPGSVRENLLYGNKSKKAILDEEIWSVLKKFKADDFISKLGGIDTYLYENVQLSTGQKQRLSLARAFLKKPQLLVMDESTSNLDFETEKEIMIEVAKNFSKMITIVVTHKKNLSLYATQTISL